MDITTVDYRKEVLKLAEQYCETHDISLGTLGKKIVNDFDFFDRLSKKSRTGNKKSKRKGGCTVDTLQRVLLWFREHTSHLPNQGAESNSNHAGESA